MWSCGYLTFGIKIIFTTSATVSAAKATNNYFSQLEHSVRVVWNDGYCQQRGKICPVFGGKMIEMVFKMEVNKLPNMHKIGICQIYQKLHITRNCAIQLLMHTLDICFWHQSHHICGWLEAVWSNITMRKSNIYIQRRIQSETSLINAVNPYISCK